MRTLDALWGARLCAGCLLASLALSACIQPKYRDPDAGARDATVQTGALLDATVDAQPSGLSDAGTDESALSAADIEALFASMEGKYLMRLFFHVNDANNAWTKILSLMEFKRGASGFEMEEQTCFYEGHTDFGNINTRFDGRRLPKVTHQLEYESKGFKSKVAPRPLGYSFLNPPECEGQTSIPTNIDDKPWLNGNNCTCSTTPSALPATWAVSDCRVNDEDQDQKPGLTIVSRAGELPALEMYIVQRVDDRFSGIRFAEGGVRLLANFESARQGSLVDCNEPLKLCGLTGGVGCAPEHNLAEFIPALDEDFACDRIRDIELLANPGFEQLDTGPCR